MKSLVILSVLLAANSFGQDQKETAPAQATKKPTAEQRLQEDIQRDIEMGRKYAEEVEKTLKLSKNEAMLARLQKIGADLSQIANSEPFTVTWGDKRKTQFPYTFKLLEGKDVNAFSLPGGYIYFYEGLLDFAESDDEVAGVVAHEIAHASFRHVATLQREQSKLQLVQIPLILATIFSGGRVGGELLQLGNLVGTALTSGWSINAEEAADYGGFQMMRKSPYNPVGMLTFMERLAKKERLSEGIDWGIYRTHPPSRERAENLTEKLNAYKVPIKRSLVTTTFRAVTRDAGSDTFEVVYGGRLIVRLAGAEAKARSAEAAVRINDFLDTVPAMFEIRDSGNAVLGGKAILFEVTARDSEVLGRPLADLRKDALEAMRKAAYTVAFRIWDER